MGYYETRTGTGSGVSLSQEQEPLQNPDSEGNDLFKSLFWGKQSPDLFSGV